MRASASETSSGKTSTLTKGALCDVDWLKTRLYALTDRKISVRIREVIVRGVRLLVIVVQQAREPVPFDGKYRHRQGKNCVPITSTELLQGLFAGVAADPSYERSCTVFKDISPGAITSLRMRLANIDQVKASLELADLLKRLGLVYSDTGYLNQAGEILLAPRDRAALDYTHRDVPGGLSTIRINKSGLSLLEEIDFVEAEAERRNPIAEITVGFRVERVNAIPRRSLREAILNGVCHRDWNAPEPTTVEHVGNELRVTSPGGLIAGTTVDNIIHASEPRYRTLMNAVRQLGLVEQEGVGVDLMFSELIRIGSNPPLIEVTGKPAVRIILTGRRVDETRYRFMAELQPSAAVDDVDAALLLWRAGQPDTPFLTPSSCSSLLQRSRSDAENALRRVASYVTNTGVRLLAPMTTPLGTPPAWRLGEQARIVFGSEVAMRAAALAWIKERRRISTTEYREMTGVTKPTANVHLKALAESEGLVPSNESGRGRGFHYHFQKSL